MEEEFSNHSSNPFVTSVLFFCANLNGCNMCGKLEIAMKNLYFKISCASYPTCILFPLDSYIDIQEFNMKWRN